VKIKKLSSSICHYCGKEIGLFEPQGLLPFYRNFDVCVECSNKILMETKFEENPLMRMLENENKKEN
jgi:DNA-directed RNA polymerase subunit RPC12/RpoP